MKTKGPRYKMKMKTCLILACLGMLLLPPLLQGKKYAGEIFYLAPGVANQAMGNTGLTDQGNLSAAWWNPALLHHYRGTEYYDKADRGFVSQYSRGAELMHAEQFEGLMQFNSLSAILGTNNRIGLVITHIGIDDIALTAVENDSLPPSADNQPYAWKTTGSNDLMAYLALSRPLTEKVMLGVTPKLAYRSLAGKTGYGFGADLGMFVPDLGSSNLAGLAHAEYSLGLNARDFFSTQLIWENGTVETALPSLIAELSCRLLTRWKVPVRLAVGVESSFEGREEAATVSFGPYSADFHLGLAVQPIPAVMLMAGLDADAWTAGMKLNWKNLKIEYAFVPDPEDELGASQRVALGWGW